MINNVFKLFGRFKFGIVAILFLGFNQSANATSKIEQLTQWMQGHFNSEVQSKEDKDFFNIHLNMKQIWQGKHEGVWLYVEQAAEGYLDKPYRQRVYQLKQLSSTKFASVVYTFDEPLKFAGDWNKKQPLATLDPSQLKEKQGCTVYLEWQNETRSFSGSTDTNKCLSKLRGATYATSEVSVNEQGIISWDRGFDAKDKQVWGAVKAGYIFLKQ